MGLFESTSYFHIKILIFHVFSSTDVNSSEDVYALHSKYDYIYIAPILLLLFVSLGVTYR